MSGASLTCCWVCGARVTSERDYLDHTLMEEHIECGACRRYEYHFVTGGFEERLGYVVQHWSYAESADEWQVRMDQNKAALAEARRLLGSRDVAAFERWIAERPDDATALLVFADWLSENGFPLNEAAIRAEAST